MRDRLADLLKKADKNCERKCITDYEDAILDNADYLIENGVVVPQWISVEDRLPNNDVRVLVSVDSDKSDTKIDTDRMVCRQWVRWGMSVTHWMPLPEPPKAEQKLKEMRGGDADTT